MSDLTLLHSRGDRSVAERLVFEIRKAGLDVRWDFEGFLRTDRARVVNASVDGAEATIVIWTAEAAQDGVIVDAAARAHARGGLISILTAGGDPRPAALAGAGMTIDLKPERLAKGIAELVEAAKRACPAHVSREAARMAMPSETEPGLPVTVYFNATSVRPGASLIGDGHSAIVLEPPSIWSGAALDVKTRSAPSEPEQAIEPPSAKPAPPSIFASSPEPIVAPSAPPRRRTAKGGKQNGRGWIVAAGATAVVALAAGVFAASVGQGGGAGRPSDRAAAPVAALALPASPQAYAQPAIAAPYVASQPIVITTSAPPPEAPSTTPRATPPLSPRATGVARAQSAAVIRRAPPGPLNLVVSEDEAAYAEATRANTAAAFASYVAAYPNGLHVETARRERQRLVDNAMEQSLARLSPQVRESVVRARAAASRATRAAVDAMAGANGARETDEDLGVLRFEGVQSYRGEVARGEAQGVGVAQLANGARYFGGWRRSAPQGVGVMHYANGLRYEGEFEDGAPRGRGVYWDSDGRVLENRALFEALLKR